MPSNDEIHRLREEVSGDEKIETTFQRLRQEGHSRLEAVQLILDALGVSLAEAKTLLVAYDTWDEARVAAGSASGGSGDASTSENPVPPAPG
ncbi:MAG: hypothetical protein BRD41_01180 [Bacteroidetes bacterium QS_1_63_11]|nr:MAG: hypothetical protein BRD41_01180 [Bacteroidetes bacterium QS_1_63_11]